MRSRIVMCWVALGLAVASPGLAGSIKKHAAHENQRIVKGVQKGQLTPKEANRLRSQQNTINLERAQAKASGKMSRRERHDIRHDQKRLSADIHHKRHNAKRATYHHKHQAHHKHHTH